MLPPILFFQMSYLLSYDPGIDKKPFSVLYFLFSFYMAALIIFLFLKVIVACFLDT